MATENDKVNTGALGTLVAVGLFATLSIALSVTALVRYSVQGVVDERQTLAQEEYRDLRQAQTEKLGGNPSWTDKGKGLVSIPIDRAKLKVLTDLQHDPASATPPAPAPTAPPTGETAALGEGPADAGLKAEVAAVIDATTKALQATPPPTELAAQKEPKRAAPAPARTVAAVKPAAPAAAPAAAPLAPAPAPAPVAPAPKPTDG